MPWGMPEPDGLSITSLTVPALAVRAVFVKLSAPPGSALRRRVVTWPVAAGVAVAVAAPWGAFVPLDEVVVEPLEPPQGASRPVAPTRRAAMGRRVMACTVAVPGSTFPRDLGRIRPRSNASAT